MNWFIQILIFLIIGFILALIEDYLVKDENTKK